MKEVARSLYANPRYTRFFEWGKLISLTGGAQAIVQGTGLICGIIVIRLLPTQEYAWYTLANTMLGTMTLLADGGIATGVMAQGGQVWQDKEKLGAVLATGLHLRKQFAVGSLLVSTPILIYLLLHHGAAWLTTLLIIASLIPAFFAAFSDSLLEIVPKLHQDIYSLQKNQITVSIGRLILSSLILFIFPFTFLAILASGLPRAYGNRNLRRIAGNFINKNQIPDFEIRKNILSIVKKVLPGAIYYCLSGQVTIWLISIFGNTASIAEIGALGRLAMLLNVFSVVISTLIIPRFARLDNNKSLLLKRFFQIVGILILLCFFIVGISWLFPQQILFILGKQYANLHNELLLNMIGSCISLIWGIIFSLYSSRGWILNPAISVIISICAIICGLFVFNISTVIGVLYLNIFIAIVQFILHYAYALTKIGKVEVLG